VQIKAASSTSSDLLVIDTDTRYATGDPTRDIKESLAKFDMARVDWHYKKVDSVLRGNVAEELCTLMHILQKDRAILAPANPTKTRVISNGQYFINGRPLHETEFANDPEFPVTSSMIVDLLNVPEGCPFQVRTWRTHNNSERGIIVAEAESMNDLVQWSKCMDEHTLAAGGSDFFRAVLEKRFPANRALSKAEVAVVTGKKLFVCGSASANSRKAVAGARNLGMPVCPMPDTLFNDTAANDTMLKQCADCVLEALSKSGLAVIAILQPVVRDSKLAQNLRIKTAALVKMVASKTTIHGLFIEGGATAEAVLRKLQWHRLDIIGQYAPGVVQMRVAALPGHYVTIKPGSYPWPKRIWWI
jgi:uncharacterized protein YgbK (DUF1537 family)